MAKLVFRLNGVEDDEADSVRQCLDDADISYYETHAGRWGLSVAAIWVHDDNDYGAARAVIENYQLQRREQQINANEQEEIPSFSERFRQRPVDHLAVWLAVIAVLALSIWPFLDF